MSKSSFHTNFILQIFFLFVIILGGENRLRDNYPYMAQKQFLGIKFPFKNDDAENFFVDLNQNDKENVRSQICHVLFTQKGTRYKNWDFGTDIIRYIFEPSDEIAWDSIKSEAKEAIYRWVNGCVLDDVQVVKDEKGIVYVRIEYSVKNGNITTNDRFIVTL